MTFKILGTAAATQFNGNGASLTGIAGDGFEVGMTAKSVSAPDSSWVLCNGASVLKATYPTLFTAIGYLTNFMSLPFVMSPAIFTGATLVTSVTYTNSMYWVTTNNSRVYTSTDMVTWTDRTGSLTSMTYIANVAYGAGAAVVTGNNGFIRSTSDYVTWTSRTSQIPNHTVNRVHFANGVFVAVSSQGYISTSPDGTTWTARTANFSSSSIHDVAWTSLGGGNGTWIAIGTAKYITSTDNGVTWSSSTTLSGVSTSSPLYVAVDPTDNEFIITVGFGTIWKTTGGTSPASVGTISNTVLIRVIYTGGTYYCFGGQGKIFKSTDLSTWTELAVLSAKPDGTVQSFNSIAWSGTRVLLAHTSNNFIASTEAFDESTHSSLPYVAPDPSGVETYIKATA